MFSGRGRLSIGGPGEENWRSFSVLLRLLTGNARTSNASRSGLIRFIKFEFAACFAASNKRPVHFSIIDRLATSIDPFESCTFQWCAFGVISFWICRESPILHLFHQTRFITECVGEYQVAWFKSCTIYKTIRKETPKAKIAFYRNSSYRSNWPIL